MLFNQLLVAVTLLLLPSVYAKTSLRVVSYNIRYSAASDALKPNEKPWTIRRPLVASQLSSIIDTTLCDASTIFGLQEVQDSQLADIKSDLGSSWSYIGGANNDGKKDGEYSTILYHRDQLRVLYSETKWLSATPDVPSKGWDAKFKRIVTLGVFENKGNGKRFVVGNTHLDHVGTVAREEGVKVILECIKSLQKNWGELGVVLTGDFNSNSTGEAYEAMVRSGYMNDSYVMAGAKNRFGPFATAPGFRPSPDPTTGPRIDYIWLGPVAEKLWSVDRYEVWPNIKDDVYLSDHSAVVGDVVLA